MIAINKEQSQIKFEELLLKISELEVENLEKGGKEEELKALKEQLKKDYDVDYDTL